ncbi:hypothetical protein JTB14_029090 [Gonioctena quinquepunctata]|nr:hypothetical protein JTB14_029090 [Gonioctena quinquepunctata]
MKEFKYKRKCRIQNVKQHCRFRLIDPKIKKSSHFLVIIYWNTPPAKFNIYFINITTYTQPIQDVSLRLH